MALKSGEGCVPSVLCVCINSPDFEGGVSGVGAGEGGSTLGLPNCSFIISAPKTGNGTSTVGTGGLSAYGIKSYTADYLRKQNGNFILQLDMGCCLCYKSIIYKYT